jgi:hypothetical protein
MALGSPGQADQVKGDIKKVIKKALEDLGENHTNEKVRKRADKLLADLDRTEGNAETTAKP